MALETLLDQIIVGIILTGFAGLFTFLWKIDRRVLTVENTNRSLCDSVEDLTVEEKKLLELETKIRILETKQQAMHEGLKEIKDSLEDKYHEMNRKIDYISNLLNKGYKQAV